MRRPTFAPLAQIHDVMEELEPTQEIARTSFEPDDPLEETQEIFPNAAITGTWEPMRRLTPCGEIAWEVSQNRLT
jgi:hypothetical protein